MFESRHKTFFTPSGARNRANAFAAAFWAGYDGLNTGLWSYSSADSKDTVGYIFYKAGEQCRKNEEKEHG